MSLADLARNLIAIGHGLTSSGELEEAVTLYRWKGQDAYGQPTYAAALALTAVVSHSATRVRRADGSETIATAQATFLVPIPALSPAVSGREEPIDKRDRLVLTNGVSGPILRTDGGLADPATGRGFVVTAYLG